MTQAIGAFQQWRQEVAAKLDPGPVLTRAAALEACGLDAERMGLPKTAAMYFLRAAEVIVDAVAEKAA